MKCVIIIVRSHAYSLLDLRDAKKEGKMCGYDDSTTFLEVDFVEGSCC